VELAGQRGSSRCGPDVPPGCHLETSGPAVSIGDTSSPTEHSNRDDARRPTRTDGSNQARNFATAVAKLTCLRRSVSRRYGQEMPRGPYTQNWPRDDGVDISPSPVLGAFSAVPVTLPAFFHQQSPHRVRLSVAPDSRRRSSLCPSALARSLPPLASGASPGLLKPHERNGTWGGLRHEPDYEMMPA
jgi:hypothetical protein